MAMERLVLDVKKAEIRLGTALCSDRRGYQESRPPRRYQDGRM